jgi:hypothetical protein
LYAELRLQSEFFGADLAHSMVSNHRLTAPDCQHQEAACTHICVRNAGLLHLQHATKDNMLASCDAAARGNSDERTQEILLMGVPVAMRVCLLPAELVLAWPTA